MIRLQPSRVSWSRCVVFRRNLAVWLGNQDDSNYTQDLVMNTMAPLQETPYEEQLQMKHEYAVKSLRKVTNVLKCNMKNGIHPLFGDQLEKYGGLPCPVDATEPSPVIDKYRNKDYYMLGPGLDHRTPTVGFYCYPSYSTKFPEAPILNGHLRPNKPVHQELAKAMEAFLARSPIPALGSEYRVHGGNWKAMKVRTNSWQDLLVQIDFYPKGATEDTFRRAQDEIREFFVNEEGKQFNVKSLVFQQCLGEGCLNSNSPHEVLLGEPVMDEEVLGKKFRVSMDSFFQVNTSAAEVLYRTVRELAMLQENTILLDIGCGTGTIGILMAQHVKKVIGIEKIDRSIEDSKFNAKINGVANAEYFHGEAAKMIKQAVKGFSRFQDVVAVLNPSRNGVGKDVIKTIRNCTAIKKMVYVSCKPESQARNNFVGLCEPSNDKVDGDPFILTRAVPVDMFPHTKHYELCLLFQR